MVHPDPGICRIGSGLDHLWTKCSIIWPALLDRCGHTHRVDRLSYTWLGSVYKIIEITGFLLSGFCAPKAIITMRNHMIAYQWWDIPVPVGGPHWPLALFKRAATFNKE